METVELRKQPDRKRSLKRIAEFNETIDHWRHQAATAHRKVDEVEQAKRRFIDGLPHTLF